MVSCRLLPALPDLVLSLQKSEKIYCTHLITCFNVSIIPTMELQMCRSELEKCNGATAPGAAQKHYTVL